MIEDLQLKIFCCCCNLKSGSLVIGTLGWLFTLFQLFYLTSPVRPKYYENIDSDTDIAAEISYGVVTLIVCVLLIFGVYKNNRKLLLPWLVLKFVDSLGWTAITVLVFVQFFMVREILSKIFFFFVLFLVTTLNWYFWVCVWSLYMESRNKTEKEIDDDIEQTANLQEIRSQEICSAPVVAV